FTSCSQGRTGSLTPDTWFPHVFSINCRRVRVYDVVPISVIGTGLALKAVRQGDFAMAVNKVAFTAVGLACIAAAGAGGYFALRQNVAPESTVATSAPTATPAAPSTPVQETESVVAPAKTAALPAKAPKKVAVPATPEKSP